VLKNCAFSRTNLSDSATKSGLKESILWISISDKKIGQTFQPQILTDFHPKQTEVYCWVMDNILGFEGILKS
jgi:hypothetical protein